MKLQVIVGGQAGSEGKGAVAGYLAAESEAPSCIRVAGPNAGHSVVNPKTDNKHALRSIPVGAVTNPEAQLFIAAGSEVDLGVLASEVRMLEADGIEVRNRLYVDPSATILTADHIEREQGSGIVGRIGSTGKGIGAARADRIARVAHTVEDIAEEDRLYDERGPYAQVAPVAPVAVKRRCDIQIEGTQGYLLSLHHAFYPKVTSSDCTALAFLGMAQIPPWVVKPEKLEVWVVFRPYPIRVAGDSGPLTGETSWEELGLPEELTTVTKKRRRVGLFDPDLAREAIDANRGTHFLGYGSPDPIKVALTMADQLDPALVGATEVGALGKSAPYQEFLNTFYRATDKAPSMVTTSDRTHIRPVGA